MMYSEENGTEVLRELLKEYYGTAMMSGFPMAAIDLSRIDSMSNEEIMELARRNGIR